MENPTPSNTTAITPETTPAVAAPAPAAKVVKAVKPAKPTKVAKPAKPAPAAKTVSVSPTPAKAKPTKAKVAPAAKAPAKPAAAPKPAKPVKHKLVRDSFTFPEPEYLTLVALKKRLLAAGTEVKKGELVRAGLALLAALDNAALAAAVGRVEKLKTGRPAK